MKQRVFKESSHLVLIFFLKESTSLWKVLCCLCTDDGGWYRLWINFKHCFLIVSINKVQDWDIVVYRDRKIKYCLKNLPIWAIIAKFSTREKKRHSRSCKHSCTNLRLCIYTTKAFKTFIICELVNKIIWLFYPSRISQTPRWCSALTSEFVKDI